ncbi:MAG: hypothetical protein QOG79_6778, partial [Mycobacterium sp.]|nr:hypothetical protein [Mycobacterium sp.]
VAVSSALGFLSPGFRSTLAPGASPSADRFGGSAFAAFGAPAELSELDLLPEGDGSSAWAIPPPNPTATQADSKKAATISRNHQLKVDLHVFSSNLRFVDNCTPLAR